MPYQNPIPAREDWQKLRDTNKVPKGAAKVSIGDSIAKARKSFSPDTIAANTKDTEQLIADADSYMKATKKYPAFESIVNTKLKKKAEQHLAFLKDITKAKTEYYPRYAAAEETWKALKLHGTGKPKDLAAKIANLKGCVDAFALIDPKWETRRPKVQNIHGVCDSVSTFSDQQKTAIDGMFAELKP